MKRRYARSRTCDFTRNVEVLTGVSLDYLQVFGDGTQGLDRLSVCFEGWSGRVREFDGTNPIFFDVHFDSSGVFEVAYEVRARNDAVRIGVREAQSDSQTRAWWCTGGIKDTSPHLRSRTQK